ncbi:RNA polymerase sigma factor [bacterium SCSIO 12741]|nr:RNA polymerase sigma factor [bacterium SCSIO 12741]
MTKEQIRQQEFLRLYRPVHDSFERFCRARVYGDMEYTDLINETLLVAFQRFENLRSKDSFLSFLIGISVRLLSNRNRKKKEELRDLTSVGHLLVDERSKTDRDAEVYLLHQALALLPDAQKECLILFEITGLKIKEIATLQHSSEDAVKQRLRRGRKRLAEILSFESEYKTQGVQHGK